MHVLLSLALFAGPPDFPQPLVEAGRDLASLQVADLDADGRADLICLDTSLDRLVSALGTGDGTFAEPALAATPPRPIALRVADVTADGTPDAIVAWRGAASSSSGGLAVFPGRGDGRFHPPQNRPLSFVPGLLALADLNRDGVLDAFLVGAPPRDDIGFALLGLGGGAFGPEVSSALSASVNAVAFGQLTGDAALDLCASSPTPGAEAVLVLAGRGAGTFTPATRTPLPLLASVAVADLDGDATDDVVAATGAFWTFGEIVTLLSDGSGALAPTYFAAGGLGVPDIQLSDLDGDGRRDVVAASTVNTGPQAVAIISVNWGDGSGVFSAPDVLQSSGFAPLSVAAADLDSRAGLDIALARSAPASAVIADPKGYLGAVRQSGPRRFEGPELLQPSIVVGRAVVAADLDGDGADELVSLGVHFTDQRAWVVARRGMPGGGLGPPERAELDATDFAGPDHERLGAGDFDGDGRVEVAAAGLQATYVFPGAPGSLLGAPITAPFANAQLRSVADWDGDGADELVERRFLPGAGYSTAFHGLRAGAFVQLALVPGLDAIDPDGGDVDGDGVADLVHVSAAHDAILVHPGAGDFTFGPPLALPLPSPSAGVARLADLDGDGLPEILAITTGRDVVLLFQNRGGGLFAPPRRHPVGMGPGHLVSADLDADGFVDVAVANRQGANVTVLAGLGDGRLAPGRTFGGTFFMSDLAVRRRAEGGPPDLVFADGGFYLAGLLPNRTGR